MWMHIFRHFFTDFSCLHTVFCNQLFWTGKIKLTDLSKEYTVVLVYYPGKSLKVWVVGDELEKLDDAKNDKSY